MTEGIGNRGLFSLASITLITMMLSSPVFESSLAASPSYITPISIECGFVSGKGVVTYELLKTGKLLGTATLECSGSFDIERTSIPTTTKPVDWKMSLYLYDSNGNVIASKVSSGRGLDASASLSSGGQSVFGKIGNLAK